MMLIVIGARSRGLREIVRERSAEAVFLSLAESKVKTNQWWAAIETTSSVAEEPLRAFDAVYSRLKISPSSVHGGTQG